jgi:FKBP-type peptidyl-prolyl cis-trans isomerase/Flp pilus assembly protein TadD
MKALATVLSLCLFSFSIHSQTAEQYYQKGADFYKKGSADDAIVYFTKAIERDPSFKPAYNMRACTYLFLKGDAHKAFDENKKSMSLLPVTWKDYWVSGQVYEKLGDSSSALTAYTSSISLEQQAEVYKCRATLETELKKFQVAYEDFSKAISMDRNDCDAYNKRGQLLIIAKDTISALRDFDASLEIDPKNLTALFNHGSVKVYLKEFDKGINDFNKGLEISPADIDFINARNYAIEARDKWQSLDSAIKDLRSLYQIQGQLFMVNNRQNPGIIQTVSGLQYQVLRAGNGKIPKVQDEITMTCEGTLTNKSIFLKKQKIKGNVNQFVAGLVEGLQLMKTGATYRFYVPAALGYGSSDYNDILAGSVLIFEVTLLSVK